MYLRTLKMNQLQNQMKGEVPRREETENVIYFFF